MEIVIPINKPAEEEGYFIIRKLDCAVIETIHKLNKDTAERDYDSVSGVFFEGDELYPSAGFKAKTIYRFIFEIPIVLRAYLSREHKQKI